MEQKRIDLFEIEAKRNSLIKDVHRLKRERLLYSKRITQNKKDLDSFEQQLTLIDAKEAKQNLIKRPKAMAESRRVYEQKRQFSENELRENKRRQKAVDAKINSISMALSKLNVDKPNVSDSLSINNAAKDDINTQSDTDDIENTTERLDAIEGRFNQLGLAIMQGNKILSTFQMLLETLTSSKSWSFADLIMNKSFIVEEVKHERLEKSMQVIDDLEHLFAFYNSILLSLGERRIDFNIKKFKHSHKTMDYLMDDIISNIRVYDHVREMLVAAHSLHTSVEDKQKHLTFMQKDCNQEALRLKEQVNKNSKA